MKMFFFVLGKSVAAILALMSLIFVSGLTQLQILPGELFVVLGAFLVALTGFVLWLTWKGAGKVRMTIGLLLALLGMAALFVGNLFVYHTLDTLDKISVGDTELVHIGVYVRSDDPNEYSLVASDYCHGILKDFDRESTDKALQQMTQKLGVAPNCQEYQRLPELIDALLSGRVDAIVLNAAYLELLQEMSGYKDVMTKIRETELRSVEIEIQQPSLPHATTPTDTTPGELKPAIPVFCVYLSGVDDVGQTIARTRSDTNILAVVNPATRQVLLINTPRDYYIPLSISKGIPDKLTHAGIYGVNVSMDTLAMLYNVHVDYYFRLNFTGFLRIIDALDGITAYSEHAFTSTGKIPYTFQKGENEMDAKMALEFCRERYSFKDGDHQRGKNQMAVIQGVIRKLLSPSLLKNYLDVLDFVEGSFEMNLPMEIVGALVTDQLQNGGEWNLATYSVSGENDFQIPYSMSQKVYVMQPDYATVDHAKELIQRVYNGEILDQ